jgi:hypothetical protein
VRLRPVTCLKYGIKNLKQVGTLRRTGRRPADDRAERGDDWYAGYRAGDDRTPRDH